MAETIIEIKDISKQYQLGKIGMGTLGNDIQRWWARLRGKEDPFLNVSDVNERDKAGGSKFVWALKDISFDVKRGEVVAIIGKNGAGKSTLLKILSQVTEPTKGSVKIKGRIASLLEVGTGFHPDLSGRENIYLNGAILGMTKAEIDSKFKDIVEFSGVQKYIDTPVKRYSSGMKVRLGFAVAAYLEPEILIVDEVLAVGDAEFQSKCLGKMQDVAGSGRTVLFVSHNLSAVRNLCQKGVVLKDGMVVFMGGVEEAIAYYSSAFSANTSTQEGKVTFTVSEEHPIGLLSARLLDKELKERVSFEFSDTIDVEVEYRIFFKKSDSRIGLIIEDSSANMLLVSTSDESGNLDMFRKEPGIYRIRVRLPHAILKPGLYKITLSVRGQMDKAYQKEENCLGFEIKDTHTYRGMKGLYRKQALIAPEIEWQDQ